MVDAVVHTAACCTDTANVKEQRSCIFYLQAGTVKNSPGTLRCQCMSMDVKRMRCMQEVERNASTSPFSHRVPITDIPLSNRLQHVQEALWYITLSRCETGTFTQTAFSPLLATAEDRQDAVRDCMRMHASMWSAAAVSKSAQPSSSCYAATVSAMHSCVSLS